MTNKPNGVLYIGATEGLPTRAREYRRGRGSAFTRKYNCGLLVYFEGHPTIEDARHREKAMKEWQRAWKIGLIEKSNPKWADMSKVAPSPPRSRPSPG